jgi:hypothetical protein
VTTSKVEKNSTDWVEIKRRYEEEPCSIKALAREHDTTDTRIRRRAKANGWKLYSAPQRRPQRATQRGNRRTSAALAETETGSQTPHYEEQNGQRDPTMPHPSEIARETCGTLDALRAHLDTAVRNLHLVREIADAETDGDDNPARARLIEKVLSLPGLIRAANDLTSAIARLADIGPGKKATAMDLAKSADSGLFATPAAPKRTLQ